MTKTISIYATQIFFGVIAIAAGFAMLKGAGVMVRHGNVFGPGFLLVTGTAEIVAGLCLLLPHGGVRGALQLTSVRS